MDLPGYILSNHAAEQLARRGIDVADVAETVARPEQTVPGGGGEEILQRRFINESGTTYLLRVFVNTVGEVPVVITAYRTSKVEKYWRPE